jgi:hypothetical protein
VAAWYFSSFAGHFSPGRAKNDLQRGKSVVCVSPIAKHPAAEIGIRCGLMFNMYQEERWLLVKLGLYQDVGLATFAARDIGK